MRSPRWHLVSVLGVRWWPRCCSRRTRPSGSARSTIPKSYPAGALGDAAQRPGGAHFHQRRMGRLSDLPPLPGAQGFVDGRSDFYGDDFEEKYIDVLNVKYGWEKILAASASTRFYCPPARRLTGALKESSHWRVVYDDGIALVFRSATADRGHTVSAANIGGGEGRDREVTKTQASDHAITETKPKT